MVKGTDKIIKREGILMIYLTIEEIEVDIKNFDQLSRKHREVLIDEENTLKMDESEFDINLNGLLKHENEELKAEADESQLLKDYVDLAIIWKIVENDSTIFGMHSVTSVFVKSISAFSKNEKKNPYFGKLTLYCPQELSHNFNEVPYLHHKVKVVLDLSNVHKDTQSVSLRALEPYEMQGEDGNVYVNMDSNAPLFNWLGTNEFIFKRPFHENHAAELECVFPQQGVYDINRFFLKDLGTNNEIIFVGSSEQYFVRVEESLL